jgi:hypothetical protein
MQRIVWVVIVTVVFAEAIVFRDRLLESPVVGAVIDGAVMDGLPATSEFETASRDESIPVLMGTDEVVAVEQREGRDSPGLRVASEIPGARSELDSRIEEDLRFTERALATSRRRSGDPVARAPLESSAPSREALAAAVSGKSAVALGCRGSGSACLSSADCCPGLGCAGGVAGFGTPGRCDPGH